MIFFPLQITIPSYRRMFRRPSSHTSHPCLKSTVLNHYESPLSLSLSRFIKFVTDHIAWKSFRQVIDNVLMFKRALPRVEFSLSLTVSYMMHPGLEIISLWPCLYSRRWLTSPQRSEYRQHLPHRVSSPQRFGCHRQNPHCA